MRHLLATHVITSSPSSGVQSATPTQTDNSCSCARLFCSSQNPKCAAGLQESGTCFNNGFLFPVSFMQMYANPPHTPYACVCNFHSKEKRPLFWMALFRPAFGTLQHSRPGRRMCLLHAFSSPRASMPVSAFQGHSLVNTEGRDPSSRRDLEPDPPACFFQLLN